MIPGRHGHTRVIIAGTGSYLPERVLTNDDMAQIVDTTDEWIMTRTGIRERHIAAAGEAASHMGAQAARAALAMAGIGAEALDMVIVATVSPDMVFPSTACFVQEQIGAVNAFCFDLEAACSGFLYGVETGRRFIEAGGARTVLVVGTEKLSGITDWTDRTTCVLFGDGAGAVVLRAADAEIASRGILGATLGSDGRLAELLMVPGGGSRLPASAESVAQRQHFIKMAGRDVFKHAVRCMCDAGVRVLEECGLSIDDVQCVIPHQANMRIIAAIAERLGNCTDKFYVNLERVGNMSGASVPVALDQAVRSGRIQRGDIVLFVVFGGGFTWGAMALEW